MHVVAIAIEIRIPSSHSLKDRRQVVRALLDGIRRRFDVSAAEVGGQDTWQRATLGVAIVASDASVARDMVDSIDRFVWSHPEIDVLEVDVRWCDEAV